MFWSVLIPNREILRFCIQTVKFNDFESSPLQSHRGGSFLEYINWSHVSCLNALSVHVACSPVACSPVVSSRHACSPVACSSVTCSPVACSPFACSPVTCSPVACSPVPCSPVACSSIAGLHVQQLRVCRQEKCFPGDLSTRASAVIRAVQSPVACSPVACSPITCCLMS